MHTRMLTTALWLTLLMGSASGAPQQAPAPAASAAAIQQKNSLGIAPPADWQITEDSTADGIHTVIVESPHDGLLIAQRFSTPPDSPSVLSQAQAFAQQFAASLALGHVSNVRFEAVQDAAVFPGRAGVREQFTLHVLGIELPHQRHYYRIDSDQQSLFLIVQCADEDLAANVDGFRQILSALPSD